MVQGLKIINHLRIEQRKSGIISHNLVVNFESSLIFLSYYKSYSNLYSPNSESLSRFLS